MGRMKLQLGQPAPEFSAVSDDGRHVRLQDLRGQWTVLYFYPRANSYGCSIEAQRFEQFLPQFAALGAQVIGISTDAAPGQAAFREKCGLSYPLLPDPDQTICRAYGVVGGLTGLLGVSGRASFVIDPQGLLVHQRHDLNHTVHVQAALQAIREKQEQLA
ncbi:alkyl hydroperoxide reductase/ Thiol specific antioxidant/ Mal allergen [Deinococcus proteolyticus MRP]|uniref:thioredoxin-dependent peroxiredoxin n=2 Tax=Deinococcaceae TaxID=183710 RepID=F0RKB6_DEIPM|nr:alkyl hydroperoxide reductase/ Thiol specific antioxidant/ Mal allergen [Deinococcus proteolyticus MRP]